MSKTPRNLVEHPLTIFAEKQTVEYNLKARADFKRNIRAKMGIWEAIELLNTLIDESDPDVSFFLLAFISAQGASYAESYALFSPSLTEYCCPTLPSLLGPQIMRTLLFRQASHKSVISFRQLRQFVEMGSQSGCRYVLFR